MSALAPHVLDLAEELRVGARLPLLQARLVCALLADPEGGVADLADRLEVHRTTVHHALTALRQKGFLTETVETIAVERTVVLLRTRRRLTVTLPPRDLGPGCGGRPGCGGDAP